MPTTKKRTATYLEKTLSDKVEATAKSEGRSVSNWIEKLIKEKLGEDTK